MIINKQIIYITTLVVYSVFLKITNILDVTLFYIYSIILSNLRKMKIYDSLVSLKAIFSCLGYNKFERHTSIEAILKVKVMF